MSVIVTGMDVPKSCGECRCTTDYYDGSTVCCLGANDIDWNNRPIDCPLKSVDGLIEKIEQLKKNLVRMTATGAEKLIKEYCEVKE